MKSSNYNHICSPELKKENVCVPDEIYATWISLRYKCLRPSDATIRTLRELRRRRYRLGLITNGPSASQWEKVTRLDLRRLFDTVIVSGDLPWAKPNRRIFQAACAGLQVAPARCLMVGDQIETDILGAERANLAAAVWVPLPNAPDPGGKKPEFTIAALAELPGLLRDFVGAGPDLVDSNSNASDGS